MSKLNELTRKIAAIIMIGVVGFIVGSIFLAVLAAEEINDIVSARQEIAERACQDLGYDGGLIDADQEPYQVYCTTKAPQEIVDLLFGEE